MDDAILALANVIGALYVGGVAQSSFGEFADAVAVNIERLRMREPPLNLVV